MGEPIPFATTRYRCPHCPRTGSSKTRMREHAARCWHDPANRSCKTCQHFWPYQPAGCDGPEEPEHCDLGVELPVVDRGYGEKTEPRLHCGLWEESRG